MKKQELAIVKNNPTAAINVTPKVSKSEAIKAAVERARQLHEKKQEEHAARVEVFKAKLKTEAIKRLQAEFRAGEVTDPNVCVTGNWGDNLGTVEVSFNLSLTQLLREWKKLNAEDPGWFKAENVERAIKAKLDTTQDRVSLILRDENNVRVIDSLLASLKSK